MLGGSYYYNADRLKRNEYVKLKKQREAQEKRDAWIRELEARDAEDKEWRSKIGRVRDAQREEEEMRAVEEMRAREAAKREGPTVNDDGRGVMAAIRMQNNAAKAREGRLEETDKEMGKGKRGVPGQLLGEEKEEDKQKEEKPKSMFGESETGGLLGIGHLKAFWNSRKGGRPEDG